ncbi:platelet factor 4-like [Meriones unguiculatus]|uniref:platelet factor 4-like n=1 Tax=Meriones unguiculatus TaxID=10047 RepID=UPI000B4E89FE|nr:platelet factor 4-like [Meriones unguiculatus]
MSAAAVFRGLRPSPELLLLGLLFLPAVVAVAVTSASPEGSDGHLNCMCAKTVSSGVHPKHITSLEVIKAGRHCAVPQLIATLKNGMKFCLDRQAPLYKKVVRKLLERRVLTA